MSVRLLQPTEPETDSHDEVLLVVPTSNDYAKLFNFNHVEPSAEFEPDIEYTWINNLGEAGYRILKPIPVEIRRFGIGEFEASFREVNIAMPGRDSNDALQALVAEILETFDVLIRERNLGPDAAVQRRILRTYIVRT